MKNIQPLQVSTTVAVLPVHTPRCKYCAEIAVGLNTNNEPTCGIPGNHSDDFVEVQHFFSLQ